MKIKRRFKVFMDAITEKPYPMSYKEFLKEFNILVFGRPFYKRWLK